MDAGPTLHVATRVAALLGAAVAVAVVARRVRAPYTVALVGAGLAVRALHLFEPPVLTGDLLYDVFLPGLLFEAALALDARDLLRNRLVLGLLAVPGVLASAALTALLLVAAAPLAPGALGGLTFPAALVFGAIVAATDPVAVIALLRGLRAPARLALLLDGESLLNDGTGVALFAVLAPLAAGGTVEPAHAAARFATMALGAVAVGAPLGVAAAAILRRLDDGMLRIATSTVLAWSAFLLAERLHLSGIIATLAAGVACGTLSRRWLDGAAREQLDVHWSWIAFALNSLVFLLLGLNVELRDVARDRGAVAVAWGAMLIARAVVVAAAWGIAYPTRERLPWRFGAVMTVGGLRGALAVVLALDLAAGTPGRAMLIRLTVGVVVMTIVLQGLAVGPLLRWLGLTVDGVEESSA